MLSRGIGMDVAEWRKEFGQQLRETGTELLLILRKNLEELKPGEMAYTLAVLADKAQALDNRAPNLGSTLATQVNNYYGISKEELLGLLDGNKPAITVQALPDESNQPTGRENAKVA